MSNCIKITGDSSSNHCPPPPPCSQCPPTCSKQEYVLSEGVNVHVDPGKEVFHDFVLHPNPYKDCGTISGHVLDKHGKPIENALVKIFDHQHKPFSHVFTNKEGQFLVCVPPGKYIIKAVR